MDKYYGDEWKSTLRRWFRRNYGDNYDVEETVDDIHQESMLSLLQWQQGFMELGKPVPELSDAYVFTCFKNECYDYFRQQNGHIRARLWLREYVASEELARDLFKFSCQNKESENKVVDLIHRQVADKNVRYKFNEPLIRSALEEMKKERECERLERLTVSIDQGENPLISQLDSGDHQETVADDNELATLVASFLWSGRGTVGELEKWRVQFAEEGILTDEDVAILRTQYFYQDKPTDKKGGDMLGLEPHNFRRRRNDALVRIRGWLDRNGFDISDLE